MQLFYALKCNLLNSTIRKFYGLMITVFYKRSKSGHLCRNLTISLSSTNTYHCISEDFYFTFYVCMHNEMLQWTRADVSKKRLWEKRSEVKVKYNKKGCTWLYSLSHKQFIQSYLLYYMLWNILVSSSQVLFKIKIQFVHELLLHLNELFSLKYNLYHIIFIYKNTISTFFEMIDNTVEIFNVKLSNY